MSYARRTDANHAEVSEAFRKLGYRVKSTAALRRFCDLVIQKHSQTWLIEVKTKKGKPTPAQLELHAEGWVIHTVRSLGEAVAFALSTTSNPVEGSRGLQDHRNVRSETTSALSAAPRCQ